MRLCSNILSLWFSAIDADEDGNIQEAEFVRFFNILDIDSDTAKATFQSMDSDGDGLVSRDEYLANGIDFSTSEDETTSGKLFWGPLLP